MKNLTDDSTSSIYYGSEEEVHGLRLFTRHFQTIPQRFHIRYVDACKVAEELKQEFSAQLLGAYEDTLYDLPVGERNTIEHILLFRTGEMIRTRNHHLEYLYVEEKLFNEKFLIERAAQYPSKRARQQASIQLIIPGRMGLKLQEYTFDTSSTDISLHYNEDMDAFQEQILNSLRNKQQRGLHLLYGKPGTGKTHFLRYLISQLNRSFIYIPSGMADSLSDPGFLQLLLQAKGDVLVLEDAEKAILSRDANQQNAVSTLLNISDGLLSDILNMQIICTFNTDLHNVDKALLRPGRLLSKYEFRALEKKRAAALCQTLGIERAVNGPLSLAEIYAEQDDTSALSFSTRRVAGF